MELTEAEKRKIEEEEEYRRQIASEDAVREPSPRITHGVPAVLSFFIPGLGQIIKGQVGKGILVFIGVGIGLVMLVIPGVVIWVWQIVDAYND